MKFSLLNITELYDTPIDNQLFFLQAPISTNALKTVKLTELETLLKKKSSESNQFINTYYHQINIGLFITNDYSKTFDSKKNLSACFDWLKKQTESIVYIQFIGLDKETIKQSLRFLVQEYSSIQYTFNELKQQEREKKPTQEIIFIVENKEAYDTTLNDATILSQNIKIAKDLCNLPSNICTPHYLAEFTKNKAQSFNNVNCTIFDQKQIEDLGMHSFLSVAKGSIEEPYFIQLEYQGHSDTNAQPIVLIGKGITFDSGGISLKPSKSMDEMKYDMCGAANVLLTFFAAVELKLPINLITLVPTCENMPSDRANKPGDVVKSLKGLSIEILNTDAEGRLILCDALTYAEQYKPKAVIDVATLTGACVVALGHVASGILGTHQNLINQLLLAAKNTQDKAWQLPIWEEYDEDLKSNFADLANIGSSGYAGTITAASFLSHFIDKKYPWAHIDIAGTAWQGGSKKGATGRPISLLIDFLKQVH